MIQRNMHCNILNATVINTVLKLVKKLSIADSKHNAVATKAKFWPFIQDSPVESFPFGRKKEIDILFLHLFLTATSPFKKRKKRMRDICEGLRGSSEEYGIVR